MEIMVTSNELQTRCDQIMRCGINVAVDKMLRDVESEIHVSNLWFHVCTAFFIQRKNCLHVTIRYETKSMFAVLATAYRQMQHHRHHIMVREHVFMRVALGSFLYLTINWSSIFSQLLFSIHTVFHGLSACFIFYKIFGNASCATMRLSMRTEWPMSAFLLFFFFESTKSRVRQHFERNRILHYQWNDCGDRC